MNPLRIPPAWLLLVCVRLCASVAHSGDWSNWRGPLQNGTSPEKNLPATFDVEKLGENNLIWKAPYGCRSCPLVLNDRVYFNSQVGSGVETQEAVICLDAKTGEKLWERDFNLFHTDIV